MPFDLKQSGICSIFIIQIILLLYWALRVNQQTHGMDMQQKNDLNL